MPKPKTPKTKSPPPLPTTAPWAGADDLRPLLVDIAGLQTDPKNARAHGERSFEAVRASLALTGQRKPIVVRAGVVIAGNGTLEAARRIGWTQIAVTRADDLTDDEAAAYALADNRTAELSEWNTEALHETLRALPTQLQISAGFSPLELRDMLTEPIVDTTPQLGAFEYRVVIEGLDEEKQAALVEDLEKRGYKCKAMIS